MNESAFPQDRRARLFGREPDIHRLLDRARYPGLTALVARPRMGKTWTLEEVARRLIEEGRFVVGYHESKASESHLLRTSLDLYQRWLADSRMREQASVFWKRNAGQWMPRLGRGFGALLESVGELVPGGVGSAVRKAFDALAEAQGTLLTAGLQLKPLAYEEARALTALVAEISKRKVVLILDAWEQSPSIEADADVFEAILRHQEDWSHAHVLLAVRHPEIDTTQPSSVAFARAKDLCSYPDAEMLELPALALDQDKEARRLLAHVREAVPAASDTTDQRLLELIDGYPGVLAHWESPTAIRTMKTADDLATQASEAQSNRYAEFKQLLPGLTEPHRTFAAGLAFLPRLDEARWAVLGNGLRQENQTDVWHDLVDAGLLSDNNYPSYGHDTRHAAARTYFLERARLPLFRRAGAEVVERLAARVTGVSSANRPTLEVLAACAPVAHAAMVDPAVSVLIAAARAGLGDVDAVVLPEFDERYPKVIERNHSFAGLLIGSLLVRAYRSSEQGDAVRAVADCTTALSTPGITTDQACLARFNRGVARESLDDVDGALADFLAVVEDPACARDIAASARFRLGWIKARRGDAEGAVEDYTEVVESAETTSDLATLALSERGRMFEKLDRNAEAVTDYSRVVESSTASAESVARALTSRGFAQAALGNRDAAVRDYTRTIEMSSSPPEWIAKALVNRGHAFEARGDSAAAVQDFNRVIELPGAPSDQVAKALVNRGIVLSKSADFDRALADFDTAIAHSDASAETLASALMSRAFAYSQHGMEDRAIADYSAVIGTRHALPDQVATALVNRGSTLAKRGNPDLAIDDLTAAIELPFASPEQIAKALYNRAIAKGSLGDVRGAMTDLDTAIELPKVPRDLLARILVKRGFERRRLGDSAGADADLRTAAAMPEASADFAALARELLAAQPPAA